MKHIVWTIVLILCSYSSVTAQIVNIESKRIATDTTGFSGNVGVSLAASQFTKTFVAGQFASQVQWKTNRNVYLIVSDFQIVNAGGESFNNSGFGHFRFNRKLSRKVRFELFTQLQYNSVTKISSRFINGIGLRFKLSPYENAKIYWGAAIMYEYEKLSSPEILNKDIRLSSYMTFTLIPVETITFRNTTYAQPLTANFKDFRLANNTRLSFGITKQLKFTTDFSFLYDSKPPSEVPQINYQVRNGLNYTF